MNHELTEIIQQLGLMEKLEDLGLDSSRDILSKSAVDLQKLLRVQESSAYAILHAASKGVYHWQEREKRVTDSPLLTTGDGTLDQVLGGGIAPGMLTEIVGESSSGKTQLGLQLCLQVQKGLEEGGLEGAAVYIHTEGAFPSLRLGQLIKHYPSEQQNYFQSHIHTMRIKDSQEQYRALVYQLPAFLSQIVTLPVRLVVIDSISAIYRSEPPPKGSGGRYERMCEICEIGTRLKKLASDYQLAVVAINQVADHPVSDHQKNTGNQQQMDPWMDFRLIHATENHMIGLYMQSLLKKPVLGLSWSNSVNTRIRLARSPMLDGLTTKRVLFVEFSPIAPRLGCEFQIDQTGIHASVDNVESIKSLT
ncbi:P-loop containing nucleoside triphosphate hydrolase protein [Blakeslea trispora]|nr:P-loop containing nucleoside triphosphate hydrolase protein [Blakeslea trispora]